MCTYICYISDFINMFMLKYVKADPTLECDPQATFYDGQVLELKTKIIIVKYTFSIKLCDNKFEIKLEIILTSGM